MFGCRKVLRRLAKLVSGIVAKNELFEKPGERAVTEPLAFSKGRTND